MAQFDPSRNYDLEQLAEMLNDDFRSRQAKREIEETMHKIINQSTDVSQLRYELVNATRGGDTRRIRQLQMKIQSVRQHETNGREF